MGGNLKEVGLLIFAFALAAFGGLGALDSYKIWAAQKSTYDTAAQQKISTTQDLARLEQYIGQQKSADLNKSIVNSALDFLFNVEKEAQVRSVAVKVLIKGGRQGNTVDFNKISEKVTGVSGMVRIPITIQVSDWKSSRLLFSWMEKSLLSRQFMIDKLAFLAGGNNAGSMKIEGYLYGREFDK